MRKAPLILLLATASIALSACAARRPGPPRGFGAGGPPGMGRAFLSPMGEPFRRGEAAGPGGRGALIDRWFAGADADGDGALTVAELTADATRFFGQLDVNRDGEIDPQEMIRYETEIAPEVQMSGRMGGGFGGGPGAFRGRGGGRGGPPPGGGGRRRGGPLGGGGPGGGAMRGYGGGGLGLLDIPQPVISADFDFNRGVSTEEFRRAAGQRFLLLDRDHDGRIPRAELDPAMPEPGRRRRR